MYWPLHNLSASQNNRMLTGGGLCLYLCPLSRIAPYSCRCTDLHLYPLCLCLLCPETCRVFLHLHLRHLRIAKWDLLAGVASPYLSSALSVRKVAAHLWDQRPCHPSSPLGSSFYPSRTLWRSLCLQVWRDPVCRGLRLRHPRCKILRTQILCDEDVTMRKLSKTSTLACCFEWSDNV
jgi:hypothetical protein